MEGRGILGCALIFCIIISSSSPVHCQYYSKSVPYVPLKQKVVTNLHFFFHDTITGDSPSAVMVARANINDTFVSLLPFSSVFVVDDPITAGPEPTSQLIGNVRGMYSSSAKDVLMLVVYFDFGFTAGEFNGSSISVFSRNPITEKEREVAVVGGRGKFKMAKGFAHLRTYSANATTGNGIVECNMTIIHYL